MSAIAAPRAADRARPLALLVRTVLVASGFVMLGFVLLHLGGNLLAFAGSASFNGYARAIRELGSPLVSEGTLLLVARVVLSGALVLHVLAHLLLQRQPAEPPVSAIYAPVPPWFATLPLSVLQVTGGVIALFVAVHISQLTIGATHPAFVRDEPYRNLVVALQFWPTAVAYIAVAVAVGLHLLAGFWTGMAALGLVSPRTERFVTRASPVIALVVTVGLAAVPAAVVFGVLT